MQELDHNVRAPDMVRHCCRPDIDEDLSVEFVALCLATTTLELAFSG